MNASKLAITIAGIGVTGLVLSGCSTAEGSSEGSSETVTLQYAGFLPESHPYSAWYLEWADEVTEQTEGRIQFENYFSGSLLPAAELAGAAADGRVDIVHTNTNYTPNLFPLSEISAVPFQNEKLGASVQGFRELYGEYEPYTEEFANNNVVPLQFQPTGSSVIGSINPIETPDEMAGVRIRLNSYLANAASEMGANAINMPLADVYQSMETGLLDAWMSPLENALLYSLTEVTPHITNPGMGPNGLSVIMINADTFASLSEGDQDILKALSDEYNERFVPNLLVPMDGDTCEEFAELPDVTLTVWDQSARDSAKAKVESGVLSQYLDEANKAGVDGEEFLEIWQDRQNDYDGSYGEYAGSIETCLG